MNPNLDILQPYPFQKIAELYDGIQPVEKSLISFAIGEPKHKTPEKILETLQENLAGFSNYPLTAGTIELRESIKNWLMYRFHLEQSNIRADQNIIPVNGTREALFAFAQAVVDSSKTKASILMPNPFYQIYEGAAFLAGAKPVFLPCTKATNFSPDFYSVTPEQWDDCQLLYLCSPGNPTGAVVNEEQIKYLITLADKHDFIIASDECYSEIYFDEAKPPVGLLEVAAKLGNNDFKRCVVFHSLSKRSNAPGLRSGFVAGDAEILNKFLLYRTYHGCAMSLPIQKASITAWSDETHVKENREQYRMKFEAVLEILRDVLDVEKPEAGFYLWPDVSANDEVFTRDVYAQQNVKVVPGSYLAREFNGSNPGKNRIRMALVATVEECIEGAERIRDFVTSK